MPYFIGLAVVFQFDAVSQAEPMLAHAKPRPSKSIAALLTKVSDCRPGMLTAPGNGGSDVRRITTSIVFVMPLKVPDERMIKTPLLSTLGELSIVGFVLPVRPVSGVSDPPLSLRTVTLNVPPAVAPL